MTERFTGHGAEWRDANLTPTEAKVATSWVELKIDKRSMLTQKDRVEDVRDVMWHLEQDGEIVVHRVADEHQPVMVKTLYGWDKKIPTQRLWHHKSCGQCGNIPGYPASLLWLMNQMDVEYLDETDQTSCTAWNYHGSGIGNLESLAAVFLRNFHQAYVAAKAQGLPEAYYYPLVHCGTSFGNYKEVRGYLLRSAKLRESVKKILGKLGRLVDGKLLIPEEVVHYSEWLHVMRDADRRDARDRLQPDPRDHPPGLPRLQDGAGGRDLRRHHHRRQPRRRVHRHHAGARRAGDRLLHLVRLLRLRLSPHHLRARVHPLVRHRPQDPRGGRGGARRRDDRPRHRLHHHARQEPVDQQVRRAGPSTCRCSPTASSRRWSAARIRTRSCSRTGTPRPPRR